MMAAEAIALSMHVEQLQLQVVSLTSLEVFRHQLFSFVLSFCVLASLLLLNYGSRSAAVAFMYQKRGRLFRSKFEPVIIFGRFKLISPRLSHETKDKQLTYLRLYSKRWSPKPFLLRNYG